MNVESVLKEYEEIQQKLSTVNPSDSEYRMLSKRFGELQEVVDIWNALKKAETELEELKELMKEAEKEGDAELVESLEKELEQVSSKKEKLEKELENALLPKDPYEGRNVIVEIRAGTGGEEAALFAGELFRMYQRFAERKGWKLEVVDHNPTDLGGVKEVVFILKGKDAYRCMKYESGVHRVQRVPITESGGRIHTSAATVAVLPEAEESEIHIDPKDIKVDTYRASGAGGQYVNKTESAVRITHIPTGIVVTCQDERSQIQNREKAMRILRSRLLELERRKRKSQEDQTRRQQIGTGDRSEKIRTYNYPQNRVTDHRIGFSIYDLESVLDGNLDPFVERLREKELEALKEKVG